MERLAPNLAGDVGPNAEYPWWDPATGDVYVPCDYDFSFFDPNSPRMIKLEQMLSSLLRSNLV
ncbi:MAG TPA: hypothetical protein VK324_17290 [Tepidisphaeraceae bacterium]|nr:hypothetical protein [Tepidisphaeraceae bacterium]